MKIELKDVMVGDELLIPSNSNFKYVKVLETPKIHNTRKTYLINGAYVPGHANVKCSIMANKQTRAATKWRKQGTYTEYVFEPDSTKHNTRISLDLRYKSLWLVKRDVI